MKWKVKYKGDGTPFWLASGGKKPKITFFKEKAKEFKSQDSAATARLNFNLINWGISGFKQGEFIEV